MLYLTDRVPSAWNALRVIAPFEACTYLVVIGGVLWRVLANGPDVGGVTGPIHGVAFAAYFILVLRVRELTNWPPKQTVLILVAAVIPFGGFFVADRWMTPPNTELR